MGYLAFPGGGDLAELVSYRQCDLTQAIQRRHDPHIGWRGCNRVGDTRRVRSSPQQTARFEEKAVQLDRETIELVIGRLAACFVKSAWYGTKGDDEVVG